MYIITVREFSEASRKELQIFTYVGRHTDSVVFSSSASFELPVSERERYEKDIPMCLLGNKICKQPAETLIYVLFIASK